LHAAIAERRLSEGGVNGPLQLLISRPVVADASSDFTEFPPRLHPARQRRRRAAGMCEQRGGASSGGRAQQRKEERECVMAQEVKRAQSAWCKVKGGQDDATITPATTACVLLFLRSEPEITSTPRAPRGHHGYKAEPPPIFLLMPLSCAASTAPRFAAHYAQSRHHRPSSYLSLMSRVRSGGSTV